MLINEPDDKKAEEKIVALYRKILTKENISREDIEKAVSQLKQSTPPSVYTWTRYYLTTDPALFWKKVKCPVLALNGEKDLQVSANENLKAIEKALKKGGNKYVTIMKFPDLNHLFQHCNTGLIDEYGEIEETFSPEVIKIMAAWILDLN